MNLLKGSLYGMAAFFCMGLFAFLTRGIEGHASPLWINFITYLASSFYMLPFIIRSGASSLKTEHIGLHLARASIGLTASLLYFISLETIPVVNATLLFNTAPLFIPIIATIFLKVPVSRPTWMAVLIGFLGILFIIKPSSDLFSHPGDWIGLTSGIALAIAYMIIKVMTKTESNNNIVFYFFVLATLMQAPFLIFAGPFPSTDILIHLLINAFFFAFVQIFLVEGYKWAPAPQVGIYQYTSIVYVGLLDWIFFHEVPALTTFIGILLVIAAGFIIFRLGMLGAKDSQPTP
jgi:drug/metabolite transporter (DMT)-like permease